MSTQLTIAQTELLTPLALLQMSVSALVSLAVWRLTAWQRRNESMEQRLHDTAGRLVDERLRAVSGVVDSHGRTLMTAMDELRHRVGVSEEQLASMADRGFKIELTLAAKLDQLKDYIRDFAAGKTDLERCESAVDRRLTRIETRLEEMAR